MKVEHRNPGVDDGEVALHRDRVAGAVDRGVVHDKLGVYRGERRDPGGVARLVDAEERRDRGGLAALLNAALKVAAAELGALQRRLPPDLEPDRRGALAVQHVDARGPGLVVLVAAFVPDRAVAVQQQRWLGLVDQPDRASDQLVTSQVGGVRPRVVALVGGLVVNVLELWDSGRPLVAV